MMPSYWNRLNELLSGNGLLFQYVLYAAIGVGLTLLLYRKGFFNQAKNVLVTLFFVVAFCVMFYLEKNPGEKIHMFQYGIFGWLLFKALALDSKNTSVHLYLTGGLICLIAGALDEVIQGILPNRYFTWHDVFINQIHPGYSSSRFPRSSKSPGENWIGSGNELLWAITTKDGIEVAATNC